MSNSKKPSINGKLSINDAYNQAEPNVKSTRVIFDSAIIKLIQNYLFYNTNQNNDIDEDVKNFYLTEYSELSTANSPDQISHKTVRKFIARLLLCRQSGTKSNVMTARVTSELQHKIKNQLVPTDTCLSKEEQDIGLFLQISAYAFNQDKQEQKKLVITTVGNRFNFDGILIINNNLQSLSKTNAYWNEFFELRETIRSAEDFQRVIEEDQTNNDYPRYIRIDGACKSKGTKQQPANSSIVYIDTVAYKAMLLKIIIPFLTEANNTAKSANTKAYVKATNFLPEIIPESFGLAPSVTNKLQSLMLEVYQEQIGTDLYTDISHIYFSDFNKEAQNNFTKLRLDDQRLSYSFDSQSNIISKQDPSFMLVRQYLSLEDLAKKEHLLVNKDSTNRLFYLLTSSNEFKQFTPIQDFDTELPEQKNLPKDVFDYGGLVFSRVSQTSPNASDPRPSLFWDFAKPDANREPGFSSSMTFSTAAKRVASVELDSSSKNNLKNRVLSLIKTSVEQFNRPSTGSEKKPIFVCNVMDTVAKKAGSVNDAFAEVIFKQTPISQPESVAEFFDLGSSIEGKFAIDYNTNRLTDPSQAFCLAIIDVEQKGRKLQVTHSSSFPQEAIDTIRKKTTKKIPKRLRPPFSAQSQQ